jgi:hypothetical protein
MTDFDPTTDPDFDPANVDWDEEDPFPMPKWLCPCGCNNSLARFWAK